MLKRHSKATSRPLHIPQMVAFLGTTITRIKNTIHYSENLDDASVVAAHVNGKYFSVQGVSR